MSKKLKIKEDNKNPSLLLANKKTRKRSGNHVAVDEHQLLASPSPSHGGFRRVAAAAAEPGRGGRRRVERRLGLGLLLALAAGAGLLVDGVERAGGGGGGWPEPPIPPRVHLLLVGPRRPLPFLPLRSGGGGVGRLHAGEAAAGAEQEAEQRSPERAAAPGRRRLLRALDRELGVGGDDGVRCRSAAAAPEQEERRREDAGGEGGERRRDDDELDDSLASHCQQLITLLEARSIETMK